MKLFYLLAAFLVLLSGLAARVILEPIQPQASANVTVIKVKGKSSSPTQISFAKSKTTAVPRCTKCII
ncbi:hypothetical protein [Flavihumibacter sp. UBA7668]|uniref:hypothetical protein n=1 Tax=Flavihumibacter sp. UBA7668 TaxID=1946542 RepID=UPI0025BB4A40|nr:hypothetical protein [Flavihumibacter sp. UBA7668]